MENDLLSRPLNLGGLIIPGRLVLAPMAGFTDGAMRLLCHDYGAALTYTEMISAKGLLMSQKSRELLNTEKDSGAVAAQLFGHEADVMAEAAAYVEQFDHISMIDINMGCPAHKITSSGEGAALLKDLSNCSHIMEKVVRAVSLPVGIKIRVGFNQGEDVSCEMAQRALDCGIRAVVVHGRTAAQGYSGTADWSAVERVKTTVGNRMAIIGNGDVQNTKQARIKMEQTGCDAVMIGRAAMGAPWVFLDRDPAPSEKLGVILRHLKLETDQYSDVYAVTSMRKLLAAYIHGMPGAAKARAAIFKMTKSEDVIEELQQLFGMNLGV